MTLPVLVFLRALRWRVVSAFVPALAALAACRLMITNNSLGERTTSMVAALAGGAGVTSLLMALAVDLHHRRPAWAWSRSLPWSSSQRVLIDALMLGSLCLPAAVFFGIADFRAGLTILAVIPWIAVRTAGLLARDHRDPPGLGGRVLLEGFVCFGIAALVPWGSPAFIAAAPFALRAAAAEDRRQTASRRAESEAWSNP